MRTIRITITYTDGLGNYSVLSSRYEQREGERDIQTIYRFMNDVEYGLADIHDVISITVENDRYK